MRHPSPFSLRLGTNYAASAEEMRELNTFLAGPRAKLAEIQAQIAQTTAHLNLLTSQCEDISQDIEDHKALMAPIRRLPVDVIQEIFVQCLPGKHNALISHDSCPVLLTQICSGWRRIALHTAELWASIHIPIPQHAGPRYPPSFSPGSEAIDEIRLQTAVKTAYRLAAKIKEWIGRSGTCALDISLYDDFPSTSSTVYEIILGALMPFAGRWGSVTCNTSNSRIQRIARLSRDEVPVLHTIDINGLDLDDLSHLAHPFDSTTKYSFWISSGIMHAPNLRRISYHMITENFTRFPLKWDRLTSITLGRYYREEASGYMSFVEFCKMLCECPLLRHLELESLPEMMDSDSENITVSLPLLTYLNIGAISSSPCLELFLQVLETPILETFRCQIYGQHSSASMLSLLRRVAQTLHVVTLNSALFDSRDDLFAYLAMCPNLVELELQHYFIGAPSPDLVESYKYFDEEFLKQLLTPAGGNSTGEVLLPRLAVFKCTSAAHFSETTALEAIKKRSGGACDGSVAKLKDIEIHFAHIQHVPMVNELDKLSKDGVECRFRFLTPNQWKPFSPTSGIYEKSIPSWGAPTF